MVEDGKRISQWTRLFRIVTANNLVISSILRFNFSFSCTFNFHFNHSDSDIEDLESLLSSLASLNLIVSYIWHYSFVPFLNPWHPSSILYYLIIGTFYFIGQGLLVFLDIVHSYSAADEMVGLSLFDGSNDCYFHTGKILFMPLVTFFVGLPPCFLSSF